MNKRFGDEWDKRVYVFLKRFENEGYLLRVPKTPEGLEEYPTPRSWKWLALDLYEGFNDLEADICSLIGEEVGMRFHAFLKLNVDIDELIAEPKRFHVLELDAKYMATFMLSSWIVQNFKNLAKAYPLIDEMSSESHEYLVMVCKTMKKTSAARFLSQLLNDKPMYRDILREISETISREISA